MVSGFSCWGLVADRSVGSMIVVMDVPDSYCLGARVFAVKDARIEEFFGQDPVVALDLAVVARGVGRDVLMMSGVEPLVEHPGAVAGSVIGDAPVDAGDPVDSEEGPGPRPETCRCESSFIFAVLGVGDTGVPIDSRVQVRIATTGGTRGFRAIAGQGLWRSFAVGAPPASVGDSADLFHIEVDHMAGPAGADALGLSVDLAAGVDELAPVQPGSF